MLEKMTRSEIVSVEVGPGLDALVAEHVMKWQPHTLEDAGHIAWLEDKEHFTEPQWTGYISKHQRGFYGYLNSTYVGDDGVRKIVTVQYDGEVWEPSTKIKMAWDVVMLLRGEGLHFSLVDTPAWFAKFVFGLAALGTSRVDGISAEEAICHAALMARRRQLIICQPTPS